MPDAQTAAEKLCPYDCGRMIPDVEGSDCCMVCGLRPDKRPGTVGKPKPWKAVAR
jgi:hypothetical protein